MNAHRLARLFLLLAAALVVLGAAACSKKGGKGANGDVAYYTCAMHPSVKSQDANAKCPICSMDLVPVKKKGAAPAEGAAGQSGHDHGAMQVEKPGAPAQPMGPETSEFMVPVERQQQIGVKYATAERRPLLYTIRGVGMVTPDTGRLFEYVSRVDGYVEELHVTSAGQRVKRGEPLMSIYSPDLLSTGQEFVNALRARDKATSPEARASADRLMESAKRRLKQWNISEQEIAELERTRTPSEYLILRSPFDGVVQEVATKQGMNVKVGDRLLSLVDLSLVWVWADFYENELPLLEQGQKIEVSVPNFGDKVFEGEIVVIDPFLDPMKRTARVRIDVPNAEWTLRPGMFANTLLQVDLGEGLTIPVSAVLPTGTRRLVFVDKGEGRLDPRFIELGRKFRQYGGRVYDDYYEVTSGLVAGERVVSSANFLIDAESKIQGAVKMFEAEEELK